ncbi:MAG: hypothetical protein DRJ44_05820 [Thermoprotei archaeon]|nr:MAG: hypothetical protein DRJ44_05820 [Thermoprotei archaeon]
MLTRSIMRFFNKHPEYSEWRLTDAGIGPLYSYAELENKLIGIYYSFMEEFNGYPQSLEKIATGDLKFGEMLDFIDSDNMVERVLFFAALTALGQVLNGNVKLSYGLKLLDIINPYLIEGSKVVVLGHLAPIVHALRQKPNLEIFVFERNKARVGNGVLSDIFEYKHLENANIAIFTGASLALPNIDVLIELSKRAKIRAVVGPSASLPIEILEKSGFNVIGGSFLENNSLVRRFVMLGSGYRTLKKYGLTREYFYVRLGGE